jgi:uncharacterized small protein (TIGR04563 family)
MIGGSAIGNVGGSGTLTANGKRRGRPPGSGKGGIGSGFNVGGGTVDARKASIYLPENIREEISAHAARLDRSVSKMIQIAWKLALAQIEAMSGIDDSDE